MKATLIKKGRTWIVQNFSSFVQFYNKHEIWVIEYLKSEGSLAGPHNKGAHGESTYKHLKLNLKVVIWSKL